MIINIVNIFMLCSFLVLVPFVLQVEMRVFVVLSIFLIIFRDVLRQRLGRISAAEVSLFILAVWAVASTQWNPPASYSEQPILMALFSYATPFVVMVGVSRAWGTAKQWRVLGGAYVFGCIVAAVTVAKNWMIGDILPSGRYTIGELNSNYVSYVMATAVPIVIVLLFSSAPVKKWWGLARFIVATSCISILCFSIILCATRGAIFSVALVVMAALFWWAKNKSFYRVSFFLICAGVVFIFLTPFIYEYISESRLLDNQSDDFSSGRVDIWQQAMSFVLDRPILGCGISAFESISSSGLKPHNVFLNVYIDLGLVGVFFYFLALFFLLNGALEAGGLRRIATILVFLAWVPIAFTGVWLHDVALWFAFSWISRVPEFNIVRSGDA